MTAREAWGNLSVKSVQQAVGSAASGLTSRASEITAVATANLTMESIQHSVSSIASGAVNVASKVAYQATSKVPGLLSPTKVGSAEVGIKVTHQDLGPGTSKTVVQQAQITDDIWEPPMNAFGMEKYDEKSEDAQLDKSLNEILKTKGTNTKAGKRPSTHRGRSQYKEHAKTTKTRGPLQDDDELNSGSKCFVNDNPTTNPHSDIKPSSNRTTDRTRSANNYHTKKLEMVLSKDCTIVQDPMRGKHGGDSQVHSHLRLGTGPTFTEDENDYDGLGVSSVWKSPHEGLLNTDRRKALSQHWHDKEDKSAGDGGSSPKILVERRAQSNRIPVRAAQGLKPVGDCGQKEQLKQGMTRVAGMNRCAAITISFSSHQTVAV